MVHVELNDIYKKRYVLLWLVLSFKAGLLNAGGFLATGRYVSHVTGFGTEIGMAIGHDDILFGIELLVIPICFIFGAFLTSFVLDRKYEAHEVPCFPAIQIPITLLLGIVCYLGIKGTLGKFAGHFNDYHEIVIMGLLCLICGMKNSLTTWATHGKIRTTHLTGPSTDFGMHLAKIFKGNYEQSRFKEKKKINLVRLLTILSFSTGSLVAALIFPKLEYKGFLLAFAISIILSAISIIHRQNKLKQKRKHYAHAH